MARRKKPPPQTTTVPITPGAATLSGQAIAVEQTTTNTKRIAVLLINFADDLRQPWTIGFIESLYDGSPKSLRDFYDQSSWGKLTVATDVFGWFTLAAPVLPCEQNVWQGQADVAATAAGVDLSAYTNIAYVWPQNNTAGSCRSAGEQPGRRNWIALQTTCDEATGVCAARVNLFHEFGHNLGLDHAGDEAGMYGDSYDVMGCCPSSLLSNIHRLQLGWILPEQVVTITHDQTVTVTAAQDQASKVYRVADGTGNYLYLENRAARTVYENGPGVWTGGMLLIRVAPDHMVFRSTPRGPAYPLTTLLDGTPESNTNPGAKGLPVGRSLTRGPATITNLAFDGVNNTVQIEVI